MMSRQSESATAKPSSSEGNKDDDEESPYFLARLDKLGDFVGADTSLPRLLSL